MARGYNKRISGKTIKILKRDEIIQNGDICRLIVQNGYDNGFDLTYKPKDWDPLSWHEVSYEMPVIIGKVCNSCQYGRWYEFARIIEG